MKTYIGTKSLRAKEMTRGDYNALRGLEVPAEGNPQDEGYLVEYIDGGKPNHPDFEGYISWSPKDVFERAYREKTGMTFGLAIEALKQGKKVARAGWNGKGMFLFLATDIEFETKADLKSFREKTEPEGVDVLPSIVMKTADDKLLVGWLASQTDILSEDWQIVE